MYKDSSARLIASYQLKSFGKLVAEDDYINYYNLVLEDDITDDNPIDNKKYQIAYIRGGVKKTDNLGNFNSITYACDVSIPFLFDVSDPESSANKFRLDHAIKIRDSILEEDLEEVKKLGLNDFKNDNGILNE